MPLQLGDNTSLPRRFVVWCLPSDCLDAVPDRGPVTDRLQQPPLPRRFHVNAARRMEAPPFDLPALLGKEFGDREGWKDVLRGAQQLALELDAILVRSERSTICSVLFSKMPSLLYRPDHT